MVAEMEQRIISRGLQCRSQGAERSIEGYAAVFFNPADMDRTQFRLWDQTWERIMPGAFDAALKRPDDVRCLFNHDQNQVLGRTVPGTLKLSVDEIGLRFTCQLPDDEQGRSIGLKISRGDITGCSFSFLAESVTWRDEADLTFREIHSLQLFDVGPVTFPAYAGTDVMLAKRSYESRQRPASRARTLADIERDWRLKHRFDA